MPSILVHFIKSFASAHHVYPSVHLGVTFSDDAKCSTHINIIQYSVLKH
jgi:hypothetical protein